MHRSDVLCFFKGCPGWGANPESFYFFILSFHRFTAEPQRLPYVHCSDVVKTSYALSLCVFENKCFKNTFLKKRNPGTNHKNENTSPQRFRATSVKKSSKVAHVLKQGPML
jgi:hypothetical protein